MGLFMIQTPLLCETESKNGFQFQPLSLDLLSANSFGVCLKSWPGSSLTSLTARCSFFLQVRAIQTLPTLKLWPTFAQVTPGLEPDSLENKNALARGHLGVNTLFGVDACRFAGEIHGTVLQVAFTCALKDRIVRCKFGGIDWFCLGFDTEKDQKE